MDVEMAFSLVGSGDVDYNLLPPPPKSYFTFIYGRVHAIVHVWRSENSIQLSSAFILCVIRLVRQHFYLLYHLTAPQLFSKPHNDVQSVIFCFCLLLICLC